MEYIGSQNASRGRRQRRSKCRLFYAFAPSRRVHLSGRFSLTWVGSQRRQSSHPTPHAWRGGNSWGSCVSRLLFGRSSLAPHLPGCHSPADPALLCLPRPHNRRLAEKFAPSLRPAQRMCAFPPRLGQEPPAPRRRGRPASGMPLTHWVPAGGGAAAAPAHLASPPRVGRPRGVLPRQRGREELCRPSGNREPAPARPLPSATREWNGRARRALWVRLPTRWRSRSAYPSGDRERCRASRWEPRVPGFQWQSCLSPRRAFTVSGPFKWVPWGQTHTEGGVPLKTLARLLASPYPDSSYSEGWLV